MGGQEQQGSYVKRVVLPSGKTIEVVYFDRGDEEARIAAERHAPPAPAEERELHICLECGSDLVYPVGWEEEGPHHWRVSLRCPNCEWDECEVFSQATVDRFDEHLDAGTEALIQDLRRLTHANMADEIDRFARAIEAGAILPEDF